MTYIKRFFSLLIKFYQRYLSVISFGSCRYYPSCSHYTLMQIEKNDNIITALYLSIIRILKCNPLFDGGFDHPLVQHKLHKVEFTRIKVKYWLIPKGKNNYFVLQNWKYNKQDKLTNVNEQQPK